jgi:hypothetical protein
VLWQVGVVGHRSVGHFEAGPAYRQLLVERLSRDYPLDHEVIVYRGATLPIERPRSRRVALRDLAEVPLTAEETVVLPPAEPLKANSVFKERLDALDKAGVRGKRQTGSIVRCDGHHWEPDGGMSIGLQGKCRS